MGRACRHQLHHSTSELDSYQLKYQHIDDPSWWQVVVARASHGPTTS